MNDDSIRPEEVEYLSPRKKYIPGIAIKILRCIVFWRVRTTPSF